MEIDNSSTIEDTECVEANLNNSETLDGPQDTADFESDANVGVAESKTDGEPTKSCISLPPLEIPDDGDKDSDDHFSPRFVPATPTLLIPSLRGKLIIDGELHVCRGVWAMSDEAHSQPGQTSDFEFKLVKSTEIVERAFPKSGKYQGWFILKQPPPLKSNVKIDEKDINMRFVSNDDGGFTIDGEGSNKFGSFTLKGSLASDGMLQMYRVYLTRPMSTKKRTAPTPTSTVADKFVGKKSEKVPAEVVPTPRESSGRMRKKPNLGSGFEEIPLPAASPRAQSTAPSRAVAIAATSPRAAPAIVSAAPPVQSSSGRAQRLSLSMQKCGDLLKELVKHPHAVWFLEPVDHVKLNIPDYPTVISVPMDFRTIRQNLEANIYSSPDNFAEHIRLVFRNAMVYNHLRDNPVHIAAKEMSSRFEEKYRLMMAHLGAATPVVTDVVPVVSKGKAAGGSFSGPGRKPGSAASAAPKAQTARPTTFGAVAKGRPVSVPGPRAAETFLPATIDTSAHHLAEMQRQMMEMQNEIMKLKTEVRQKEIQAQVASQREAAHNPLTYEEKKALIQEIQQLPGAKMEKVVEMIKSAMPTDNKDDGDEIEIPLDELDTLTLRKLQAFVAENAEKPKKRPGLSRQSSFSDEHVEEVSAKKVKKERSPRAPKPGKNGAIVGAVTSVAGPVSLIPFPSNEQREDGDHAVDPADLLFSCDSFEDMHGEQEDDDGEGEAGSEISGQANAGTEEGSLANFDAWTRGVASAAGLTGESTRAGTSNKIKGDVVNQIQLTQEREVRQKTEAEKRQTQTGMTPGTVESPGIDEETKPVSSSFDRSSYLKKRREEEIRRRASLERTVNLDAHEDEEMMALLR